MNQKMFENVLIHLKDPSLKMKGSKIEGQRIKVPGCFGSATLSSPGSFSISVSYSSETVLSLSHAKKQYGNCYGIS